MQIARVLGYTYIHGGENGDHWDIINPRVSVNLAIIPHGAIYLPTKDQLSERNRTNRNEFGNYWYWSSSVFADDSSYAYGLVGAYGAIVYDGRSFDYGNNAVRCVRSR